MDSLPPTHPPTMKLDNNKPAAPVPPPASPPSKPPPRSTTSKRTPRFPRNPCPSAHHTLSLISSERDAQRIFGKSFTLRSPAGELRGPFALLAYTDSLVYPYLAYIHRVVSTPLFSERERQLIVLAVAGVTGAEYVQEEHRRIARAAGLEMEAVEGALAGERVGELSKKEETVYGLALEMAENWGRVSDETWRNVVVKDKPKVKGQEGFLECEDVAWEDIEVDGRVLESDEGRLSREEVAMLAQVVASSMFVSVLVNCADVEVPQATRKECVEQR